MSGDKTDNVSNRQGKAIDPANQYHKSHAQANQIFARDSTLGAAGHLPIGAPSTYSASSYPSYSAPAYAEPVYEYEEDYDDKKKKKIALSIALPLAIALGPLALIGLASMIGMLINIKAVFTLSFLKGICAVPTFTNTLLCNLIGQITIGRSADEGRQSSDGQTFGVDNLVKFMTLLREKFTLMDHLEE